MIVNMSPLHSSYNRKAFKPQSNNSSMTYQEFIDNKGNAKDVEEFMKGIASRDPNKISVSRNNLDALINNTVGPQTITDSTTDSVVLNYSRPLENYFDSIAIGRFSVDPEDMVDQARISNPNKFTDNYLSVTPTQIPGDQAHNTIATAHVPYYALVKALKDFSDQESSVGNSTSFIVGTTPIIIENTKQNLIDPHAAQNAIDQLANLVGATYQSAHPERALFMANYSAGRAKTRLDAMVSTNDRADYTERTLKTRAAQGGNNVKVAADDLYEVIA
jgi:hypothetical protein